MFYPYVLRYGVSAPGAASQSQGRSQFKVIEIPDSAEGGGGIHKNTAGFHCGGMLCHLFRFRRMHIEGRRVAVSAVCNELLRLC